MNLAYGHYWFFFNMYLSLLLSPSDYWFGQYFVTDPKFDRAGKIFLIQPIYGRSLIS